MDHTGAQNSYDRTPYRSSPFPQTHPSRIGAIARLYGLEVEIGPKMRVLELGCASGGNLMPLAQEFPEAEFIGIDASGVQIASGQTTVAEAGLKNIQLIHEDIREFTAHQPFDYIICHGVYSWVSKQVQEAILTICQNYLSDYGVAYISYNTFPGWKMRGTIRDIMQYRAKSYTTDEDQLGQSRTFLEFLVNSVGGNQNPYALMLRKELTTISKSDDYYLLHEYLEDTNTPEYFYEFAEKAAAFGLDYIAEADFGSCYLANLPEPARSMLISVSHSRIEVEQYLDFLRNRTFRQTLLCRSGRQVRRQPTEDRLLELFVSSNAKADRSNFDFHSTEELVFERGDGRLKTTDPVVKVAFSELEKRWPERIPFRELASLSRSVIRRGPVSIDREFMTEETRRLAKTMLQCYASTMVDLHCTPSLSGPYPESIPKANSLQRYQAHTNSRVTTLLHTEMPLDDFQRQLVMRCDGQRTRQQIAQELDSLVQSGDLVLFGDQGLRLGAETTPQQLIPGLVDQTIHLLWKSGLLSSMIN